MTRLTVQPPRTFDERLALIDLLSVLERAGDPGEGVTLQSLSAALHRIRAVISDRAETDDGTPPEDALRELSQEEMFALLAELLRSTSVPPVNGEPSRSPPTGLLEPVFPGGLIS